MTEQEEKALALKNVQDAAKAAATAVMPDLIKAGLGSDEAKNIIKNIVNDATKEFKVEDFDGTEKAVSTIIKEMQKQHDELSKAFNEKNSITLKSAEEQVAKFIQDNFDKIKSIRSSGHGVVEFEVKAVETISTGSATSPVAPPGITGTQLAPVSRVNMRSTFVNNLVTNFNTSLAAYPYTEAIPKDGDAAFVAEGTAKPQIDLKFETRYATPVKAAAWERLTDESVQDIPGLQSVATGFLRDKHDIRKQRGILTGDGIAPNPKGALTYGRAFVAGAMALQVKTPNFMDVVNAAITDIFTTHNYQDEMPYLPSLVLVNPVDFYLELVSAKDTNGLPLYPQAGLFNQVNIGGVTIIPDEMVPAGKIFVGDMSKYNVSNYVGYTVKIGWVNDDFIKNQFVILGESRFHAFVKKLDEKAFIYDDIVTIKNAITKP